VPGSVDEGHMLGLVNNDGCVTGRFPLPHPEVLSE
jgi:hypothetical protein